MKSPPCPRHGLEPSICVSRDIGARIHAGAALDFRCRPILLAYPDQPPDRAFAVAYLDDADYARAEHRAAGRLMVDDAYADDPQTEATIRELMAGDIPLLIGRKARHAPQHDFGLIESSKRRMRSVCALCLEEALKATGHVMRRGP